MRLKTTGPSRKIPKDTVSQSSVDSCSKQPSVWAMIVAMLVLLTGFQAGADALSDFENTVEHHTTSRSGASIHYAMTGSGDPVLFVHGFPDHWLTWWRQMDALSSDYSVASMDLRGFNLSDQPTAPEAYAIENLIADVEAVISDVDAGPVTLVGHDWGGFLAWHVAMERPDLVSRLVVVNIPHPWSVANELATNPEQVTASQYVDFFRSPGAAERISRDLISNWVTDPAFLERHHAAMERSDLNAMLNYYRAHYPQRPYRAYESDPVKIKVPTLVVFGALDPFLLVSGLGDTWNFVAAPLTMVIWPDAGHFSHHDQPDRLTELLLDWLSAN